MIGNSSTTVTYLKGAVGIGVTGTPGEQLDVTGNIKSSGNMQAAKDTDTTSYLGRAAVGYSTCGAGFVDVATFCHHDFNNTADYCLLQDSNGVTVLNSKAGAPAGMLFGIGGAIKMELSTLGRIGLNSVPSATDYITVGGNIRAKAQVIAGGLQSTLLAGGSAPATTTTGFGTLGLVGGSNDCAGTITIVGSWTAGDEITLTYNSAKNRFTLSPYGSNNFYGKHFLVQDKPF